MNSWSACNLRQCRVYMKGYADAGDECVSSPPLFETAEWQALCVSTRVQGCYGMSILCVVCFLVAVVWLHFWLHPEAGLGKHVWLSTR
jgi:hypothetical protein